MHLCVLLLLICTWPEVLVVVGVEDVYDEVEMQVEFQFLGYEVTAKHLHRDQHLPGCEELVLLSTVKGGAQRIQQCLCIIVQPIQGENKVNILKSSVA